MNSIYMLKYFNWSAVLRVQDMYSTYTDNTNRCSTTLDGKKKKFKRTPTTVNGDPLSLGL